ncbi:MAG: hypothetical protein ACRC0E_06805 [Soonwooa sp.]
MKTNLLVATVLLSLVSLSCKKNEGGNKGVIPESSSSETTVVDNNGTVDTLTTTTEQTTNATQTIETSVAYKGLDGTRAKATFSSGKGGKTLVIESANNQKYQLDFKSKTADGEHYERNGVSANTKGDSLIISQGDTEIPLVKVK